MHGSGTLKLKTGEVYTGEFENNRLKKFEIILAMKKKAWADYSQNLVLRNEALKITR